MSMWSETDDGSLQTAKTGKKKYRSCLSILDYGHPWNQGQSRDEEEINWFIVKKKRINRTDASQLSLLNSFVDIIIIC